MKVTDTRIRVVRNPQEDSKLKAYVDITFDECFVVHGLKIIEGQNSLFLAMPSKKMVNGEFKDIVHPIKPEFREEITSYVLARYEEEKDNVEE